MGFFGRKPKEKVDNGYEARGIRFVLAFTPLISDTERQALSRIMKTSKLSTLFSTIETSDYGNSKDGRWSLIKVYCPNAKFRVSLYEAEKTYTDIFYYVFGLASQFAISLKREMDVMEYSFLYRFKPKEKPDEFVPLVPLKTIGAFIFWRRLYGQSLKVDLTKAIPNKQDKERFKSIIKKTDDARPIVEENRDFILSMAQKIGLWKPYQSSQEFKPTLAKIPNVKMEDLIGKSTGAESVYYHYMPLTDAELKLINRYIETDA